MDYLLNLETLSWEELEKLGKFFEDLNKKDLASEVYTILSYSIQDEESTKINN